MANSTWAGQMDQNKLLKLKQIGYQIYPSCVRCKHANFLAGREFGLCRKHAYCHQKHSKNPRQLSIHISGYCNDFESNPLEALEAWKGFVKTFSSEQ